MLISVKKLPQIGGSYSTTFFVQFYFRSSSVLLLCRFCRSNLTPSGWFTKTYFFPRSALSCWYVDFCIRSRRLQGKWKIHISFPGQPRPDGMSILMLTIDTPRGRFTFFDNPFPGQLCPVWEPNLAFQTDRICSWFQFFVQFSTLTGWIDSSTGWFQWKSWLKSADHTPRRFLCHFISAAAPSWCYVDFVVRTSRLRAES